MVDREEFGVVIKGRHRLENPGKVPLELIEVQNGDYVEEDYIVLFGDDYGMSGGPPTAINIKGKDFYC